MGRILISRRAVAYVCHQTCVDSFQGGQDERGKELRLDHVLTDLDTLFFYGLFCLATTEWRCPVTGCPQIGSLGSKPKPWREAGTPGRFLGPRIAARQAPRSHPGREKKSPLDNSGLCLARAGRHWTRCITLGRDAAPERGKRFCVASDNFPVLVRRHARGST